MQNISSISLTELTALIEKANDCYWNKGVPEIEDAEYDLLLRELRKRVPEHPLLTQVYAPSVSGNGEKVRHDPPMLSLNKAYSLAELKDWAENYTRTSEEMLLIQPKYDGISALWDGRILSTRGDGLEGENITGKLPLIELETIGYKGPLSRWEGGNILGEIVIREDDFNTLYKNIVNKNGDHYKNSRNAVAGIMGLKEIGDMLAQHAKLTLVDYNLHSKTIPFCKLEEEWANAEQSMRALPYPMDGIVVRLADTVYADSLGSTVHHPRGRIAYKFSGGLQQRTKLINVIWSFGKNCLTPLAEFEPVEITGTRIRKATLHNLQNVLDHDIQIGDYVTVARAGDVIPYIVTSEPGEDRRSCLIEKCPSCGHDLVRDLPELRCTNPDCPETCIQRLLAAITIFGIDGFGESKVRDLAEKFHIRHAGELFRLGELELQQLDGVKKTAAQKLYRQIQNARNTPEWKILTSLNIKGIGGNIAQQILKELSLAELRNAEPERLSVIKGIGPERAKILYDELKAQSAYLDDLLAACAGPEPEQDLFSF